MNNVTGLTITNPLVLYRALVATNRISPDPSQLRLAIHLQKLYERLKDYEPVIEYRQRLNQVGQVLKDENGASLASTPKLGSRGVWTSLLEQKAKRDSLALTRVLNSHEAALQLDSPKGLMLHGEVGTGKSMLIDLFADCLPTRKKKRWHFNTFMLETFARLEQLRRSQLAAFLADDSSLSSDEYSMLWLARELVKTSPILFLDEFQLPDRTSSKIMSSLMTNFFQLGGVLIATSNRMPDELAKAAGMEFVEPSSRLESLSWKIGLRSGQRQIGRLFPTEGEFGQFLELLKARCEVWEMDGGRDYRRGEAEKIALKEKSILQSMNASSGATSNFGSDTAEVLTEKPSLDLPINYYLQNTMTPSSLPKGFTDALIKATGHFSDIEESIHWIPATMTVYGRNLSIPRTRDGAAYFTFMEICATHLGPADYISLASTFHTIIITDIPILTVLLKNEARRFITLLDALYEARCKILISAAAGPDEIFFPESRTKPTDNGTETSDQDAIYPETFSEVHQDLTSPFRPNISSYGNGTEPDYTHARLQGILADDALEDDPPNRIRHGRVLSEDERREIESTPNFGQTVAFTGDDERFAYKRAASRLWEMCGKKWWDRDEEGWWKPLPKEARRWETSISDHIPNSQTKHDSLTGLGEVVGESRAINEKQDNVLFKHSGSPFRTQAEPPPKISWTHVWGTGVNWGKRAGIWGQGVEGWKDRKKGKE